jgi:hypothetical protein
VGGSDAEVLVQQLQTCRSPGQLLGLLRVHAGGCTSAMQAVAITACQRATVASAVNTSCRLQCGGDRAQNGLESTKSQH